jgi:energy-coupling factor transport system substrate-specific component
VTDLARHSGVRAALFVAMNVAGALAFAWPFALPSLIGAGTENHRADGPWILLALTVSLGALLFLELGQGGLGPKTVALLGVLGAAVVALRLPGFVAGFSALFVPVLIAGNAFGAGFGFLLGAVGMLASAVFLGGLGPWVPFQMVAVGWVGAGAGLLPRRSWRFRIGALATYGFFVGYAYGAVMNLWSWPFVTDGSALAWDPSAAPVANLRRYAAFYGATSFAWDTFRAIGNAALVLVLGRPLLRAMDRAARRMRLRLRDGPSDAPAFTERAVWPDATNRPPGDIKGADDRGGDAMATIPPAMWEDPKAFEPDETREIEEQEHRPVHPSHEHEHGPDCGHEAIQHGDHCDYVHDSRRHYMHDSCWREH